ncbi:MAG: FKBP-type peptidyl-prolyl cis-trans isomerase [Planctomycetaceae bacterium]|nr:FKBP-type peptidyl-prolyl cis-trans isomerase [Planctomycetaceae bacterium]
MKTIVVIASLVALAAAGAGLLYAQDGAAPQTKAPATQPAAQPKVDMKQVSYIIGASMGRNMKQQGVELDVKAFNEGLQTGLSGGKPALTDEQMQKVMEDFQRVMIAKQEETTTKLAAKNLAEGQAFLAKNKTEPGVKVTASGLQYKIINEGTGPSPKPTDTVTVNYRGTFIDGTEFDSSFKRKEPATIPLDRVIRGWSEGLQLLKKGGKAMLYIPPNLAYGAQGQGPVGPNATLIFEVELLGIGAPIKLPGEE